MNNTNNTASVGIPDGHASAQTDRALVVPATSTSMNAAIKIQAFVRRRRFNKAYRNLLAQRNNTSCLDAADWCSRAHGDFALGWMCVMKLGIAALLIYSLVTTIVEGDTWQIDATKMLKQADKENKCFRPPIVNSTRCTREGWPVGIFVPAKIGAQYNYESDFGKKTAKHTWLQNYPYFEGFQFTIAIRVHLITACILFALSPFVVREIWMRYRSQQALVTSVEEPLAHDVWLDNHAPWMSLTHHHLLMVQVTMGMICAGTRLVKRGFSVENWSAVQPGFTLALYLQFSALTVMVLDSIAQLLFLRIYALSVPSSREWQIKVLDKMGDLTVALQIMCLLLYFVYDLPFGADIAYVFVFFIQTPLTVVFGIRNDEYWQALPLSERLINWQSQLNRHAAVLVYVTITTFLANIGLRLGMPVLTGVVYLVADVVIFYLVVKTEQNQMLREFGYQAGFWETVWHLVDVEYGRRHKLKGWHADQSVEENLEAGTALGGSAGVV